MRRLYTLDRTINQFELGRSPLRIVLVFSTVSVFVSVKLSALYNVLAILIKQNSIISCSGGGLEAFSVESQEKIGYLRGKLSPGMINI